MGPRIRKKGGLAAICISKEKEKNVMRVGIKFNTIDRDHSGLRLRIGGFSSLSASQKGGNYAP